MKPIELPFPDSDQSPKVEGILHLVLTYLTHQVSAGPEPAGS
jgi:hypothetical protein